MVNVKKHLKIPIDVKHFIGEDDTGYQEYTQPVELLCYIDEEAKVILNALGKEELSDTTLYFDGAEAITVSDIFVVNGRERLAKAMSNIRSKKGHIVMKVVNL